MGVRTQTLRDPAAPARLSRHPHDAAGRLLPLWARLVLTVVGAVALLVAFPPWGWGWTAPIGIAVLAIATRGASLPRAALLGALAGTTFFGGLLSWLMVVGVDAWLALTVLCSSWWVLLLATQALVQRMAWWPILVPALWVASEALRGAFPLGGFPWGRLVFSQAGGPLLPLTSIVGTAGVTYMVALAGCLLAFAATATRRRQLRHAAIAAALLIGSVGLVGAWDDRRGTSPDGTARVDVAIVQGGVPGTGLSAMDERRAVLNNHTRLTTTLASDVGSSRGPLDFVVWPENSTDIDPYRDPTAWAQIDAAVKAVGVPVLVGAVVEVAGDPSMVANTGIVWDPVTGPGQSYVKRHPVPFGEYLPLRSVLGSLVDRFSLVPRDFVAGTRTGILAVGGVVIGDVICFEVAYDALVRDVVVQGAQVLVVQTNNATYGGSGQLAQQLAMSQVRAVEHGRTVLVAATSGISAVIDPDGSIRSSIGDGSFGILRESVAPSDEMTIATRWGGTLEVGLVVLAVVGLLWALIAGRRRRRGPGQSRPKGRAGTPRSALASRS